MLFIKTFHTADILQFLSSGLMILHYERKKEKENPKQQTPKP